MNDVGKILKFLRISKGWNQIEMAKRTNITSNYLSLIENGKRKPPKKYLTNASEVLGVAANLFAWEDIDVKKFQNKKSKKLAQKINKDIHEIRNHIVHEIVTSIK